MEARPPPENFSPGDRREGRPLAGRLIVLTRSEANAAASKARLEELGARVLVVPATRQIASPLPEEALAALRNPQRFTHVVFTSAAAARFFVAALAGLGLPTARWRPARLVAMGAATGRALEEAGLPPTWVGAGQGGKALALDLLRKEGLGPGHRVLLPRSAIAREELADLLAAAGVQLEAVTLYETVPEDPGRAADLLRGAAAGDIPDAIAFFSPSALHGFLHMTGDDGKTLLARAAVRIVTIGPTTSAAVREAGFHAAAEASAPDADAVARAVVAALAG